MIINKQVLIELTLGKYKDEILCDIVPMEATHILLGRLKVTYDGMTNKFSFEYKDKKITLKPLSPYKFLEDQIKMKENEIMKKWKN
ncbi:hypothetical protein CR513_56301, partial [Mucuna pruriens]